VLGRRHSSFVCGVEVLGGLPSIDGLTARGIASMPERYGGPQILFQRSGIHQMQFMGRHRIPERLWPWSSSEWHEAGWHGGSS
jgi:hypothetical protein